MSMTATTVWDNCLTFIKDNLSEDEFRVWFAPIIPISLKGAVLSIQVPTKFYFEHLEANYIKILKVALTKTLGKEAKLVYNIALEKPATNKVPQTVNIPSSNKNNILPQEVKAPLSLDNPQVKNPFILPGLKNITIDPQLNPNYSFANFIEGDSNRLARSAGMAISKRPGGTAFNPLFIYSDVGLGKTHLANAIGLEIKELHPEKTVLYVSAEKFTQQFVDSTRNNTRNDFIMFYQMIDVLIVDDVQFLSGKKGTQDVFFHIFNHLHQNNKQLIFTSDKSPVDIQDMEQRLISRFKWGLSADLQIPDFETKTAILENKLYRDGIEMDGNIVEYIAQKVNTNVRELEGALNSIIAQSSLNHKEISIELVQKTLANFVNHKQEEISIEKIQRVISDYFDITIEAIQSKTRKRDIVQARQMVMYFAKKYTKNSLSTIGEQIGKRDHATVLHACKTIDNLAETDKNFRGYIEDISRQLAK